MTNALDSALVALEHARVVDEEGEHDLASLSRGAKRVADALDRRDVPAGARVIVRVAPGSRWIEAFAGITLSGRVAVPVLREAPREELAYLAADAGARIAISDTSTIAMPNEVFTVPLHESESAEIETLRSVATGDADPERPALMLYTSGTTGRPKGAVLSHRALGAQIAALRQAWALEPGDTLLHALPMHHLHGIVVAFLASFTAGARVLCLDRFEARTVWRRLGEATIWMGVPTMYQRLVEAFDAASDLERESFRTSARALRLATSGSAALAVTLAERWRSIAGAIPVERYGMTEIGVALSNPIDEERRRVGTVGCALDGVEMRIVDEAGKEVQEGELWIRGPSLFSGYFGRADATRDAFSGDWFKTGDVGRRENDGYVRLLGRTSVDILKTGGEKVSALEIEEAIRALDVVREVAVVGVPDATWGDRVTAVVVAKPDGADACTTESFREALRSVLAPYKLPKEVILWDELPKNAMGKVVKPEILARLARAATARINASR